MGTPARHLKLAASGGEQLPAASPHQTDGQEKLEPYRYMPRYGSSGWRILRAITVFPGRFTIAEVHRYVGRGHYSSTYRYVWAFKLSDLVRAGKDRKLWPMNDHLDDEMRRIIDETSGKANFGYKGE